MKRALLATAGTVAGLVTVLAYSPPGVGTSLAAGDAGAGLGGPAVAGSDELAAVAPVPADAAPTTGSDGSPSVDQPAAPVAHAARSVAGGGPPTRPGASAGHSSAARTTSPAGSVPASPSGPGTPRPHASHRSTARPPASSSAPHPTVTPTKPAGPVDITGAAVTYRYGTLQVAIRVQGGKIVDAWAVAYPKGDSAPYSEMAIPILRSQTLSSQSAKIAGATGASLTSASWITSLTSALAKAGL